MEKIDLKKQLKHLYQPSAREVVAVDVPPMNFLMVDGEGDPNTAESFAEATEVLYALSYTLKFMVKKGEQALDYAVMPLEGLWWSDDMAMFSVDKKGDWKWTLMIMQPDVIVDEMVHQARDTVKKKKNPPALELVRFEGFHEGVAAQTMHIGPFADEGPTIEKVHAFIDDAGSERRGNHHEIYLTDIRRAAPEKWRTVIRQPMTS